MDPETEVTVVVDPPADPTPSVTVVETASPDGGTDGDVIRLLSELAAGQAVLAERVAELDTRLVGAEITAEVAEAEASAALQEIERVEVSTEEAVADLAETAEADTPEVVAEVEDIAPDREHGWFARRGFTRKGNGE